MHSNKTNMVYFFKDIESNIIEEAIIMVKDGVNISEKSNNKKIDKKLILKEAELIINNRKEESEKDFLNFKIARLLKINKILKVVNIVLIFLVLVLFLA